VGKREIGLRVKLEVPDSVQNLFMRTGKYHLHLRNATGDVFIISAQGHPAENRE
jgi:hypothetical protein